MNNKKSVKKTAAVTTRIVILDRGWVYVGTVKEKGDDIVIENARCIRRWGTTQGLGELVNGPLTDTRLEAPCTVITPKRAVIHQILCLKNW